MLTMFPNDGFVTKGDAMEDATRLATRGMQRLGRNAKPGGGIGNPENPERERSRTSAASVHTLATMRPTSAVQSGMPTGPTWVRTTTLDIILMADWLVGCVRRPDPEGHHYVLCVPRCVPD